MATQQHVQASSYPDNNARPGQARPASHTHVVLPAGEPPKLGLQRGAVARLRAAPLKGPQVPARLPAPASSHQLPHQRLRSCCGGGLVVGHLPGLRLPAWLVQVEEGEGQRLGVTWLRLWQAAVQWLQPLVPLADPAVPKGSQLRPGAGPSYRKHQQWW